MGLEAHEGLTDMAATNVQAYRVYGGLSVQVGTSTNNALETLGVTQEGGTINITRHRRPVYSDVGGPETPVDIQDMGETAMIRFSLIAYNEDVLRRLAMKSKTGIEKVDAYGNITPRGRCIGTDGGTFRLFLPPSLTATNVVSEESWYFGTCDLTNAEEVKIGTVVTTVRMEFYAFPYIAGDAVKISAINADAAFSSLYVRTNSATAPS